MKEPLSQLIWRLPVLARVCCIGDISLEEFMEQKRKYLNTYRHSRPETLIRDLTYHSPLGSNYPRE